MTSQEILIRRLEEYRIRNGMNYGELSRRLNIPYTTITEIIQKKRIPRIDTIDMIAEALDMTTSNLLRFPTELVEELEEESAKAVFASNAWQLSDEKQKMLYIYLRMLEECTFIK